MKLRHLPWFRLVRIVTQKNAALLPISLVILGAAASVPAASAQAVTFTGSGAINFGSVNVCPSGQTTPAPCSNTLTLSYKVTASGTLGTPQVLTVGAPNLDFTLASGSTCTGAVTEGNICTVNVSFAPLDPGTRNGGVEIVDGSGSVLANTYIYGAGAGPAIGFDPPTQITLSSISNPITGLAVAVDGRGNVFIADPGTGVEEMLAVNGDIPADPTIKVIGGGVAYGVALDGSGNVFYSDMAFDNLDEILAAGGYTTGITLATSGSPLGVAVDASGTVFFSDNANNRVDVLGGTNIDGFGNIAVVAVDASGNVFVVDATNTLKEALAADGYSTIKTLVGGFSCFCGIAVDGNGNIFVVSSGDGSVKEVLAAGGYTTINTLASVDRPLGVAVDRRGNVFIVGRGSPGLVELRRSQPPAVNFPTPTPVGSVDTPDGTQSVQIQNIGNANLIGTVPSVSPNWDLVAGSGTPEDCTASFSLAPGSECNLSISFGPTEYGPLTGSVTLQDNALNATSITQSIPLSGTGGTAPLITSLSANYGTLYAVVTLTGTNFGTSQGARTVTLNGVPANAYAWSNTSITVSVPGNATSGNIVVTASGETSNGVPFTVEPQPSISGISPTSGPAGTVVTISGQNLLDAEGRGTVYLNALNLPILSPSNNSFQVVIPAGATSGAFDVHINGDGRYTPIFTVPGTSAVPEITSFSPIYGALGSTVTLTGTNFGAVQGSSSVLFTVFAQLAGLPGYVTAIAVPTAWSNTSITLSVPYHTTVNTLLTEGALTNMYTIVVTVDQRASNAASFFVEPRPSLTGISPTSGPAETVVTISGQNLLDAGGRGTVFFNGVSLPILNPSRTSIQVVVPPGATTGGFDVHINGVGNYTPTFSVE